MAVLALVGLTVMAAAAAVVLTPSGIAAAAAPTCDASPPAHVSFRVVVAPSPTPNGVMVISAVTVSGLGPGCNGLPAELRFSGNAAGDPAASATLLSTATSTRDPCTQSNLSSPPLVRTGAITLDLCSVPGTMGSDVSVHDLTGLTLYVGGTQIVATPVTSPSAGTGSSSGSGTVTGNLPVATAAGSSRPLAFTGTEAAVLAACGLLAVVIGLVLWLVGRQSRQRATCEGTS